MQNPCKYCKSGLNFLILMEATVIGDGSVYLMNDTLTLAISDSQENYNRKDLKINYCPMCGRKLSSQIDHDDINHPAHYTAGKFEVIDVIEDWNLNYNLGNALKYIGRADHKGTPVEDLKKGIWYIQRDINNRSIEQQPDLLPF